MMLIYKPPPLNITGWPPGFVTYFVLNVFKLFTQKFQACVLSANLKLYVKISLVNFKDLSAIKYSNVTLQK